MSIPEAPTIMPLPASATSGRLVRGIDPWITAAVVLLLGIGTVMVYSASAVRAYAEGGEATLYLLKHLTAIAIGLVALAIVLRIPVERWSQAAYPLLVVSILLLIAVFIPGVGKRVNGAYRWIVIGSLSFQPSELAKLSVVVYLAHSLAKKREKASSFSISFWSCTSRISTNSASRSSSSA